MIGDRERHEMGEHSLFTVEDQDGVLVVDFTGTAPEILGIKLDMFDQLRRLLADQRQNPSKAVVFTIKSGILSPEKLDEILKDHGIHPTDDRLDPRPETVRGDPEDFLREMNSAIALVNDIRSIDAFVMVALGGTLPLSLFGPALACDYRIAANDFSLVNRIPETGFAPLAGLPWFLTQMFGSVKARELLMRTDSIAPLEGLRLGLIDQLAPPNRLRQDAITEARRVAALPWGCRVGLKRAMVRTDQPLLAYLEKESVIFERSVDRMILAHKALGGTP